MENKSGSQIIPLVSKVVSMGAHHRVITIPKPRWDEFPSGCDVVVHRRIK